MLPLNGPESDGDEVVLHIPSSSSITGTSPLDSLMLYLGYLFEGLTRLQRCSRLILQLQPTGCILVILFGLL